MHQIRKKKTLQIVPKEKQLEQHDQFYGLIIPYLPYHDDNTVFILHRSRSVAFPKRMFETTQAV